MIAAAASQKLPIGGTSKMLCGGCQLAIHSPLVRVFVGVVLRGDCRQANGRSFFIASFTILATRAASAGSRRSYSAAFSEFAAKVASMLIDVSGIPKSSGTITAGDL